MGFARDYLEDVVELIYMVYKDFFELWTESLPVAADFERFFF